MLRELLFRNNVVVYSYIVGDLLHKGHVQALLQAKNLGDILIVGVITDEGVAEYKRLPVISLDERIYMVEQLGFVNLVVQQEKLDPIDNLKILQPDIVVHGDDWGDDFPGAEYMRSIGKQAIRIKYYPYQSTTYIINEIIKRNKDGLL